jgi:predicted permease
MSWFAGMSARLREMLKRSAAEERLEDEIAFHIEQETEQNVLSGMSRAEARRRALLSFGGVEKYREKMRDGRRVAVLEDAASDLRFAVRSLRRSGSFAVVAAGTLALGIGASVAMFSVLNAVLLRPLAVVSQEELVVLWAAAPARGTEHLPVSWRELSAFREQARAFSGIAGVAYQGAMEQVLLDAGEPVSVAATWVTGDFLQLLGVAPVLGRALLPADDVPGADPVMVISHGLWQRQFGGHAGVIGRTLEWDGRLVTVVGVLPAGFEYPAGVDVWTPVIPAFPATLDPGAGPAGIMVFNMVGRLRAGLETEAGRADFGAFLHATDADRAPAQRGLEPVATPLPELITGDLRPTLWAAAAAVSLLLLIACVNVANLLLIRGSARTQELAVRSALGAGRGRLVRQLLAESGVLAAAAGTVGVLLAIAAVRMLTALAPAGLPQRELIVIDVPVLLFALAATAAAALLSGLLPAARAAGDLGVWLRGRRSTDAGRHGGQLLRHSLVVGQVALTILVVAAAGLLVRSLHTLQGADMGFNHERLLIVPTMLPPQLQLQRPQLADVQEAMVERVSTVPGVISATALPRPPFSGEAGWTAMYSGEGQLPEEQATNPWVNFEVVGPEYFTTLQVPLLRGRGFERADREEAARVAVVSEAVARHTWPGGDALGQQVKLGPLEGPGEWHTVVGVVGDTRYRELARPHATLYLPTRQFGGPVPMTLAVRIRRDASTMIPELRTALQQVHPDLVLLGGGTVQQLLAEPLAQPRFSALLIGAFGAITLLLAVVGIYAALAATMRQRTREMGIRAAFGARAGDLRALVLAQGMRLALMGCALGLAGALLTGRLLRSLLYEVSPTDPGTFIAVVVLILAASALACYLPARRASRADPALTLRAE